MADSRARVARCGSTSARSGTGQLWNGPVGSRVDWLVGHAVDPAAQGGAGSGLGHYLAGWFDCAGVISLQLDDYGHPVWLSRLADSRISPQERSDQCHLWRGCVQRDQCRGVAFPWPR